MDSFDPSQQLVEAVDLVSMLECLTENLSQESTTNVPWAGIALTLRQVRERISQAYNTLPAGFVENSQPVSRSVDPFRATTLADRLQQLPVAPSRARDLVAGTNSAAVSKSSRQMQPGGRLAANDSIEG